MAEPGSVLQKSNTIVASNAFPFDQLPKVVVAHLTVQKALRDDPSEASLSYPIQSYLGISRRTSWTKIDPEENHPAFRDKRLGRKFQIDFVGKLRKGKKENPGVNKANSQRFAFALETKLHIPSSDWGRIVHDLVKLLLLAEDESSKNAEKYILLAFPISSDADTSKNGAHIIKSTTGERVSLKQTVWFSGKQDLNLFEVLLPYDRTKLKIRLSNLPPPIQSKFRAELKICGKTSIPGGDVEIRKIGLDWSDDFACGIWKLLASGKPFEALAT